MKRLWYTVWPVVTLGIFWVGSTALLHITKGLGADAPLSGEALIGALLTTFVSFVGWPTLNVLRERWDSYPGGR